MSIYQSDSERAPDEDYEPGVLDHLVVGNQGRQLDWRRTPMSVVAVRPDVGFFTMRIDGFEDVGATWDLPFENVHHYQFENGSSRAPAEQVSGFHAAIERFDRPLEVPSDPSRTDDTNRRIGDESVAADHWLAANSSFLAADARLPDPDDRVGIDLLYDDIETYLGHRGVADIEATFSRQFVSNPYAGEVVKGHRIVVAELGLVPYVGTVLRDPATFEGDWTRERRAEHVCARLGFVRALFRHLDLPHITLYRGFTAHDEIEAPRNHTFVSASFSPAVARSHLHDPTGVLHDQAVPVERVFMTYLETRAMNQMFLEAEAILLFDAGNERF